jgi:large subunit ribosomal protein L13
MAPGHPDNLRAAYLVTHLSRLGAVPRPNGVPSRSPRGHGAGSADPSAISWAFTSAGPRFTETPEKLQPVAAMRTTHVRAEDTAERWLLYDASQHTLGRMAAEIARRLTGKDLPTYTPSEIGAGAHVVVIHSKTSKVSGGGTKELQKEYQRYSGYPGGLHRLRLAEVRERRPNDIVTLAVRRMLPKTRAGRQMLKRLHVYPGADHPHQAQQPTHVQELGTTPEVS